MLTEFLNQEYGIIPEHQFQLDRYQAFQEKSFIYIMMPVFEREQEEIIERFDLAEHYRQAGEKYVPIFMKNKKGSYISSLDHHYYLLLRLDLWRAQPFQRVGKRLAKFHYRGAGLSQRMKELNRVGKWKELWEKRIGQLEKVWHSVVLSQPANEFEKLFLESFPYYAGLTENAIQYYVDTTLDEQPGNFDYGTVCHERFSNSTWKEPLIWKNPFSWIVDHPVRDLSEYTRDLYFSRSQVYKPSLQKFIQEYQSVLPLSPFSWRLYYSRLILPLHYISCVETYFGNSNEPIKREMLDKLTYYLDRSDEYERFLASFYEVSAVPVRRMNIPQLDWLKK